MVWPQGEARLFTSRDELGAIRRRMRSGLSRRIWRNLRASAIACTARQPRLVGIEPVDDDPNYENLYDRFYAMMSDAAELEHLAWATAVDPSPTFLTAATTRLAMLPRAWRGEARREPDYGSAYATTRLLRAVAVALDLTAGRISLSARRDAEHFAIELATNLWGGWLCQPGSAGRDATTHHAHMEWGSFGVAALALLDHVPEATRWVDAAVRKFDRDLLPHGLAPDGAQTEGASFWASTMTQRLAFMDALRRVTGIDLFERHEAAMSADISIAAIAVGSSRGRGEHAHASIVFEPGYAQLPYHAPALLGLARFYRRPHLRQLAAWDRSLGFLHEPAPRTARGERLRFALGGHALAWDDPSVGMTGDEPRLALHFPSVNQAYLRHGWQRGGTVVGVDGGRVVVHRGGRPVLVDLVPERVLDRHGSEAAGTGVYRWEPGRLALAITDVVDAAGGSFVRAAHPSGTSLDVELLRSGSVRIRRTGDAARRWWSAGGAILDGDAIRYPAIQTVVRVRSGRIVRYQARGYREDRRVGYGDLRLIVDREPAYPLVHVEPDDGGRLEVEVAGG